MASVIRGVIFCSLSASCAMYTFYYHVLEAPLTWFTPLYVMLAGSEALLSSTLAYLTLRIIDKRTSPYHTYLTLFYQSLFDLVNALVGKLFRQKFERDTETWRETQDTLLREIFERNAETEHGKKFQFRSIKSKDEFRRKHPLTKFESYRQSIERVLKGEKNILTANEIVHIALTSGTTGGGSMFPVSKRYFSAFFTSTPMVLREIYRLAQGIISGQKILFIRFGAKSRLSECGLSMGSSTSYFNNESGMIKTMLNSIEASPPLLLSIHSEPESLYVQSIFALRDHTISAVNAVFAHSLYSMFLTMETNWEQLVDDIAKGRIDPNLDIPVKVHKDVNRILQPDPQRAKQLAEEFKKGFHGIAKRVWPYLHFMSAITTGSMKAYCKRLNEYYAPGIPLYSYLYSSSEGCVGVNLWPSDSQVVYALLPRCNFYEFIPVARCDQIQPDTLFSEDLEIGKEYEIVLTNEHGLYRYRLGDVLKVVRYHNNCPVVEFMYRRGQLLNIRSEKTPETAVYQALQDSLAAWQGVRLVDYTCTDSVMLDNCNAVPRQTFPRILSGQTPSQGNKKNESPYYVLFVELERHDGEGVGLDDLSTDQLNMFDENLRRRTSAYDSFRSKESIAPTRVYLMNPGSFRELRRYLIENSQATLMQYKLPRVLKRPGAVNLMMKQRLYV
ncbi:uncharacterized protein LOC144439226 [Glandiceps talaboti]